MAESTDDDERYEFRKKLIKALNDEFLDQSSMPQIRRRLIHQRPDYRGTALALRLLHHGLDDPTSTNGKRK
jgi:hypothetical protein